MLTLIILIVTKMILKILLFLIIHDVWLDVVNLKNAKHLKKDKQRVMLIAWHPKRWLNFCMTKKEKKEIEPIFTK